MTNSWYRKSFKVTDPELPTQGLVRVVQVLPNLDRVILIPIPTGPRKEEGNKKANYYARGFIRSSLAEFSLLVDQKRIVEHQVKPPWLWSLSDKEINNLYPRRTRNGKARETTQTEQRDENWALIKPLVDMANSNELTDLACLDAAAEKYAKEKKLNKVTVKNWLHRYYAFGCIKNAVLPNFANSGAKGKARYAKNGVRLGRRNAAAKAGKTELAGKVCDEKDRQNLEDGWVMYVRKGTPNVHEAYMAMCQTFYSTGTEIKQGTLTPTLLPANMRPTEREFRYHGPKANDGYAAARRLMGEGDWAKDYRPLIGKAHEGVQAIGQLASLDASPIDVNLTACFDRLSPIGVGRGLFVREADLGLYFGYHVGIGGLGTNEAKLAILDAASDKTKKLQRYGLNLPPEDFPSLLFSRYLTDNGELRSANGIESCVDQLGSKLDFIPSGRSDQNSVSESGHHARHRGFDHHLEGTTRGRQRQRGEPLAISKALLYHYEYVRLLIQWIHWVNCQQQVPHLRTIEMIRDGVKPTRIDIYRWKLANGYVAGIPADPLFCRAQLLPSFKASVQRNGLVLHRPGTGNTVELLEDARFNDRYLAESGLYRYRDKDGKPHIEVRANPDDLSEVLLIDLNGIHVIKNTSNDLILVTEGCVADLCAKNERGKIEKVETASKRDQDESDQRAFRKETEASAKEERQAEIERRGKPDTHRQSVRDNQAKERDAQLDAAAKRAAEESAHLNPQDTVSPSATDDTTPTQTPSADDDDRSQASNLTSLYASKLSRFHQRRSHP